MWTLDNEPAPRDPGNGWLLIDGTQYPPDWPRDDLEAMGLVWVEPEIQPITAEQICREIDAERDARIDSGFTFGAHTYQSRPSDRENVMGAAQLALAYLGAGGDPLSLRWANPDADFVWIAADNQTVELTAPDVVALFQAGVAFKSALTFYARAMKDAVLAAEDTSSVQWNDGWPS